MVETKDITRPPAELVKALQALGCATACATLHHMGIHVYNHRPIAHGISSSIPSRLPHLATSKIPLIKQIFRPAGIGVIPNIFASDIYGIPELV